MSPIRFTTIAHRDHLYCNPVSPEKMERVLDLLDLAPYAKVLDVGCGKGELLIRLAERFRIDGLGVDVNRGFLAEARSRMRARVPDARIAWVEGEAASLGAAAGSFDLAAAIGASHALGGYRATLEAFRGLVRSGGRLLVGEGYWRREPPVEYLEVLGASAGEFTDHAGNVARAVEAGLVPLYAAVSSPDEWDHYEGLYNLSVERHLADHPDDPDAGPMAERIRRWRRGYLEWGRETLGFAVYLFQKPR